MNIITQKLYTDWIPLRTILDLEVQLCWWLIDSDFLFLNSNVDPRIYFDDRIVKVSISFLLNNKLRSKSEDLTLFLWFYDNLILSVLFCSNSLKKVVYILFNFLLLFLKLLIVIFWLLFFTVPLTDHSNIFLFALLKLSQDFGISFYEVKKTAI